MNIVNNDKMGSILKAKEYLNRYEIYEGFNPDNVSLFLNLDLVNAIEADVDVDLIFNTVISSPKDGENDRQALLHYLLINEYEKKVNYLDINPYSKRVGLKGSLITDNNLMSEGNSDVSHILTEIQNIALKENETNTSYGTREVMMDRIDCMDQALFKLDGLNIRGVQLLDAMEYTKGSAQLLYEIIKSRKPDKIEPLLSYINNKAALRILNGESVEESVAYCDLCESNIMEENCLVMTQENASMYLSDNKPLDVNYSKVDICSFISKYVAIEAAKARGFRIIKDTNPTFEDGRLSSIIMYNDKTGAIISAPGVGEDNFCYAGCELYFTAKGDLKHSFDENVSFNRIPGTDLTKCQSSYTDGLFSYYDKCVDKLIPSDNFVFPIPSYVRADDTYFINFETHPFINDVLVEGNRNLSSRVYAINNTINLLLLKYDNEIQNSGVSLYEPLKDKEICRDDSFIKELISKAGLRISEIEKGLNILNIAFCYLQVPETEQTRIVEAVENKLENNFEKYSKSPFAKNITIKDVHESFRRYKAIRNDDVAMNKLFDALKFQEVETIPVDLPWEIKERKEICKDDIEKE